MTPDIKNFIFIGDERQNNQTYNMVIKQELKRAIPTSIINSYRPGRCKPIICWTPFTPLILKQQEYFSLHGFTNTPLPAHLASYKFTPISLNDFRTSVQPWDDDNQGQRRRNNWRIHLRSTCIQPENHTNDPINIEWQTSIRDTFYEPSDAAPTINYNVLLRKGMSPYLCPPGTIFFNKPPTFWEQYGYFILGTIVCFILLALFFQYRISHLNKLKKIQQKEIDTMTSYKT